MALGNERPCEMAALEKEIMELLLRVAFAPQTLEDELRKLSASTVWKECESLPRGSGAASFFNRKDHPS